MISRFWIVLDQGRLSEYTNWKQSLELHMEPIDLRMASVREARNADRRFCFEVITPQYTRVYQATNEEDMKSWISAVNNALQTAVESTGKSDRPSTDSCQDRLTAILPLSSLARARACLVIAIPMVPEHRLDMLQ